MAQIAGDDEHALQDPDYLVPDVAPGLATAIVTVVCCGFGALAFSGVVEQGDPVHSLLSLTYVAAMLTVQLGYFSRPTVTLTPRATYVALVVQACLVYLPILQFGTLWLGFPGFLAGSALISLPARRGIPVFVLIVLGEAVLELIVGARLVSDVYAVTYTVVSTVITGLVVYGLTRLARLVGELHAARYELRSIAVAEERLRFARDAHDLLGMSLAAITLKAELTNRLMTVDPGRARAELADISEISRKTMSEVRSVASGGRELSLTEEARAAESALAAADIVVRVDISEDRLLASIRSVLATVLREAVANVLRHSEAQWCEISVWDSGGFARMEIVNDGASRWHPTRTGAHLAGNGVRNMAHRISVLEGELHARCEPADRFRVSVAVPIEQPGPPPNKIQ